MRKCLAPAYCVGMTFHSLTPAQRRQLVASYAVAGTPLRVTMRDRSQHDVVFQSIAQDERKEADEFSSRGSLAVARFYRTPQVLVLRLADLWSVEPLTLLPTDPNSPGYEREQQVVRPIPREALAARKTGGENRHAQR